jgi:hypothetical protein
MHSNRWRGTGEGTSDERREPETKWTTAASLYDPWGGVIEVQVMTEFYRTGLALKLSPVFSERAGAEPGEGQKYNYKDYLMIVLDLPETIRFRAQLEAFASRQLARVEFVREPTAKNPGKRLLLLPAEDYYGPDHPDYELNRNGLAVAIEQDMGEKTTEQQIAVICRPQELRLADDEEPFLYYPEIEAFKAIIASYVANCARVDFASVRLLENRGGAETGRASGSSARPPPRRGLGAPQGAEQPESPAEATEVAPPAVTTPAARPAIGLAARRLNPTPGLVGPRPAAATPTGPRPAATNEDIEAALGGKAPAEKVGSLVDDLSKNHPEY